MSKRIGLVLVASAAVWMGRAAPAGAAIITVGGTPSWADVKTAVANANPGDEIRIVSGTITAPSQSADQQTITLNKAGLIISGGWNAGFDARTGETVLNANSTDNGSVFNITAAATVAYLGITGGKRGNGNGAGIRVQAAGAILSHLDVYGNLLGNNKVGGGIYNGVSGTVVEYCDVHDNGPNFATTSSVGYGIGGIADTKIFNSTITGNTTGSGASNGNFGAGVGFFVGSGVSLNNLLFGSLLTDNTLAGTNTQGSALYAYTWAGANRMYVVNSTVADNGASGQYGIYVQSNASTRALRLINSILSGDQAGVGDHAIYSVPTTLGYSVKDDSFVGLHGALTETGNYAGDPTFADRPADDYSLGAGSNAIDLGSYLGVTTVAFTGGSANVLYVDVDGDSSYTAKTDVIVDILSGAAPAMLQSEDSLWNLPGTGDYAAHYIYTTDLAGNARVLSSSIDAGAYEYAVPEPATLAFLAFGGLALAGGAVARRRRA